MTSQKVLGVFEDFEKLAEDYRAYLDGLTQLTEAKETLRLQASRVRDNLSRASAEQWHALASEHRNELAFLQRQIEIVQSTIEGVGKMETSLGVIRSNARKWTELLQNGKVAR